MADQNIASNDRPLSESSAPAAAAKFLASLPPYSRAALQHGSFSGRGIVICAGGVRYLTCAWVLINMLRRLGCNLPIEVWYLGEEERDPNWVKLIEPLGVRCVDACAVRNEHPHPRLHGWECKAYAMLHCPFEEVLLLDADNVPVVDPSFLFDSPEYLATGAIFWPDCYRSHVEPVVWRIFGVPYQDQWQQESGQVLVNKKLAWRALNLCDWYNQHSDFFYRYVYGDKDTFRFAWHRAGIPYAMPDRICQSSLAIFRADWYSSIGMPISGRWPGIARIADSSIKLNVST